MTILVNMTSMACESKSSKKAKKQEKVQCGICWNDCNKSNRKVVDCPYCHLQACRECVKYYLTSKTDLAHCMGCNKPWDRKFLQESLTKSYFNGTWKGHRKDMLFETEKARFPDTMPKVEQKIEISKHQKELQELKEEEDKAYEIYLKAKNKVSKVNRKIQNIKWGHTNKGEEKRQFIKKCPADNCTGFLSSGYKCAICEVRVCSKCHEIMGYTPNCKENHECNPDTVAAVELIKQDTKPCPQCSAPIYKISGCDQMWCTCCNIAFSWRTGLKVTGTIHNPHYYEFMRQNGGNGVQNPGAVNCGGLPYHGQISRVCRNINDVYEKYKNIFTYDILHWIRDTVLYIPLVHRGATHFQHTVLDPIRRDIQRNRDNEDLRVSYIMKEITEERFKINLIKRDNAFEKKQSMLHIYELMGNVYVETVVYIYNLSIEYGNKHKNNKDDEKRMEFAQGFVSRFKERKQNLDKVRQYCNKELMKVSIIYCQVVELIDDQFNTSKMKKQECQKLLASKNYSLVPKRNPDGRTIYTNGKTYRSRRPKYVGLDE